MTTNDATATARSESTGIADPTPIAFGLFAFALAVYGVRFVTVGANNIVGATSYALNYAILVAAIGQTVAGVLAVIKGAAYSGWVTTTFGIWLGGFYVLLTHQDPTAAQDPGVVSAVGGHPLPSDIHAALQQANVSAWHAASVSVYVLVLLLPVIILAARSVLTRNWPFVVAFAAIIVLLILLGWGFSDVYSAVTDVIRGKAAAPSLGSAVSLLKGSAYAAFVGALAVAYLLADHTLPRRASTH